MNKKQIRHVSTLVVTFAVSLFTGIFSVDAYSMGKKPQQLRETLRTDGEMDISIALAALRNAPALLDSDLATTETEGPVYTSFSSVSPQTSFNTFARHTNSFVYYRKIRASNTYAKVTLIEEVKTKSKIQSNPEGTEEIVSYYDAVIDKNLSVELNVEKDESAQSFEALSVFLSYIIDNIDSLKENPALQELYANASIGKEGKVYERTWGSPRIEINYTKTGEESSLDSVELHGIYLAVVASKLQGAELVSKYLNEAQFGGGSHFVELEIQDNMQPSLALKEYNVAEELLSKDYKFAK